MNKKFLVVSAAMLSICLVACHDDPTDSSNPTSTSAVDTGSAASSEETKADITQEAHPSKKGLHGYLEETDYRHDRLPDTVQPQKELQKRHRHKKTDDKEKHQNKGQDQRPQAQEEILCQNTHTEKNIAWHCLFGMEQKEDS